MMALAVAAGFALGSTPNGYLLFRARTGEDLRRCGSGSTGAANVARNLGLAAGLMVFVLDVLKGAAAVAVAQAAGGGLEVAVAAGVAAVAGHVFSPWLGFQGGKGVATGLGMIAMLSPQAGLGGVMAFAVVFSLTRIVSLGSLSGALVAPFAMQALERPHIEVVGAVTVAAIVFWCHRENLRRLRNDAEPRFGGAPTGWP